MAPRGLVPTRERIFIAVKIKAKKEGETRVTFLLSDPGWYAHKPDVQNKGDDNTTHTQTLLLGIL